MYLAKEEKPTVAPDAVFIQTRTGGGWPPAQSDGLPYTRLRLGGFTPCAEEIRYRDIWTLE